MLSNALEVSGVLTLSDIRRFNVAHQHKFLAFSILMCFGALAGVVNLLLSGTSELELTYIVPLGAPVMAALFWVLVYFQSAKLYRNTPHLREPLLFRFDEERIGLSGKDFTGEMAWKMIHRLRETKTAFFIYHNAAIAWVLPKRFLGDIEAVDNFRKIAIARLAEPKRYAKPNWIGKFL